MDPDYTCLSGAALPWVRFIRLFVTRDSYPGSTEIPSRFWIPTKAKCNEIHCTYRAENSLHEEINESPIYVSPIKGLALDSHRCGCINIHMYYKLISCRVWPDGFSPQRRLYGWTVKRIALHRMFSRLLPEKNLETYVKQKDAVCYSPI